jgi:hypothetical protein
MSSMFGNDAPAPAPAPTPKPPAPMPDTNSPAVLEARRKAQLDIMGRAGRQSTILTAPKDRGGDYTSTTLGAGNS